MTSKVCLFGKIPIYLNISYVIGLRPIVLFHKYVLGTKHCVDAFSLKVNTREVM